jgi:hypothetical protein
MDKPNLPRRTTPAGYPNPEHPENERKFRRYLRRNRGDESLAYKEWREDTHPAFGGAYDTSHDRMDDY